MADVLNNGDGGFEKELGQLQADIDTLIKKYEQYFMGIERVPPETLRNTIARRIRQSDLNRTRSTAIKFRFRTVASRFASYLSYWERMMRMIEDGTFKRDRHRNPMADHPVLQRRMRRVAGEAASGEGASGSRDRARRAVDREARLGAGAGQPDRPDRPEIASLEDRLRSLYGEYVKARRQTGESVERLTFDKFQHSILKTRAAQITKLQCDDLDYRVRIRDGRASLVAQPIRAGKTPPTRSR